jgi:hypothetical protein
LVPSNRDCWVSSGYMDDNSSLQPPHSANRHDARGSAIRGSRLRSEMSNMLRKYRIAISVVCGIACFLLIVGLVRILPYLNKLAVAVHQRSVTASIADWGRDYSRIYSQDDALRAKEMIRYIKTYYVPSDGYPADPKTEAALEDLRKLTIEKITAAIDDWEKRSQR